MAKLSYKRWALAGLLALLLLAPGTDSAFGAGKLPKKPKVQKVSLLYVLNSDSGTLIPKKGKGAQYKLVLKGLDHAVIWFSDRPARKSGSFPISALAEAWKAFGFRADPPNAALTYTDPSGNPGRTVIVELSHPRYAKGRLAFAARVLDPRTVDGSAIADHAPTADRDPARAVKDASLFIDDGTAPVAGECLLQPFTRCEGMDLGPLNLSGMDLHAANFSGSDLDESHFAGANLAETMLVGTSLRSSVILETDLQNADLEKADLIRARLGGSYFESARLVAADLTEADLTRASLSHASLTDANFTKANLDETVGNLDVPSQNVNFTEATVIGPFLVLAKLFSSNFERADLSQAFDPPELWEELEMQGNNFCHAWLPLGVPGECRPRPPSEG